jgi:hypothetical protein
MASSFKIGVLFCIYGQPNYIDNCLAPWIKARDTVFANCEWVLGAVSVPFSEYKPMFDAGLAKPDTQSEDILNGYMEAQKLDFLLSSSNFYSEAEARTFILRPLLQSNCDYVILVDVDEFYEEKDILAIVNFISLNPWVTWFRLSLKNYVFDTNTYLRAPFTPPRVFKVSTNGYKLDHFYFDNDVHYKGTIVGGGAFKDTNISYTQLPAMVIPKTVAFIKHYSWLNNEVSKAKVAYQEAHFKHGAGCSFKWSEANVLTWNMDYFKAIGQRPPEVLKDA